MMGKGCLDYIVQIFDLESEAQTLQSVPVVKEF